MRGCNVCIPILVIDVITCKISLPKKSWEELLCSHESTDLLFEKSAQQVVRMSRGRRSYRTEESRNGTKHEINDWWDRSFHKKINWNTCCHVDFSRRNFSQMMLEIQNQSLMIYAMLSESKYSCQFLGWTEGLIVLASDEPLRETAAFKNPCWIIIIWTIMFLPIFS